MKIRLILSANAGICLQVGTHRIWVDALHSQQVAGFSAVDEQLLSRWLEAEEVSHPDAIFYTHCHPDHFSGEWTSLAVQKYPGAALYLPEKKLEKQNLIHGNDYHVSLGDLQLRFIKLPHDGAQYAHCLHYGILITAEDKHILIPGDCRLAEPELLQAINGWNVDLALLNFPWMTLARAKDFVQKRIRPKHLVLYHLPFEKDDVNGYIHSAQHCGDKAILLYHPMQEIVLEI